MNDKPSNNTPMDENIINEINNDNSNEGKDTSVQDEKKSNKYIYQERWQKKAGYISKTYKLRKELVDNFAAICRKNGISQASQLSILMQEFINKISD